MLLYVYYTLIGIILLAGVKFAEVKGWNDEFLSLQESKAIQAICAILIVFHHMSQEVQYCKEIQVFKDAGILFVGIFMFCSGYGLIKSLNQKKNYLDHFLRKRLVTVLVPFYLINTLFFVYNYVMDSTYRQLSGKEFAKEAFLF